MNVLHVSMFLIFDLVNFAQMYSTLKLFSLVYNYDHEYLIEFIHAESDQGSFGTT